MIIFQMTRCLQVRTKAHLKFFQSNFQDNFLDCLLKRNPTFYQILKQISQSQLQISEELGGKFTLKN